MIGIRGATGKRAICCTIPFLFILMNIIGVLSAGEKGESVELDTGSNEVVEQINFTHYHSYEEMTGILEHVAKNRPDIAVLYSIGKTFEGRDVWALKISDNPSEYEPDEPEVLYIGMHHAREWISHEIPLFFIEYIMQNYGTDPQTTFVVNNRQLWIIPMLNPDGYVFDGNGDYSNRQNWRKNREPNWDGSYGTDLNRNYGWHWGELGYQGYANPRREDYIGPYDTRDDDGDFRLNEDRMDGIDNDGDGSVDEDTLGGFSTAETRIIRDLAIDHDFKISMSYHSYAETIYWGWMYTRQLPPDEQLYKHIAEGINRYCGYDYRNYTEDDRNRKGPLVDGDLNDYLYGAHGVLAFCIEVGSEATGGFYPPEDLIIPLCELNLMQNLYVAEIADNPWEEHFSIEHTPVSNATDTDGPIEIMATVKSSHGLELSEGDLKIYYSIDDGEYNEMDMDMGPSGTANEFCACIPARASGTRISYYFFCEDSRGRITLLPKYAPCQTFNFTVGGGERKANPILTRIHGTFMMGTLVFFLVASVLALMHLSRKTDIGHTFKAAAAATLVLFIGGFPLGWAVAYQEYGVAWTGIPFGWDLVDNVTLILFILWTGALILGRNNLHLNKRPRDSIEMRSDGKAPGRFLRIYRNGIGHRGFAISVIALTVLTSLVMIALPHGS